MMQWKTTKSDDGNATHTAMSGDREYVIDETLADDGIWEYFLHLRVGDDYVDTPFAYEGPPFAELGDAMEAAEGLEVLDVVYSPDAEGYTLAERDNYETEEQQEEDPKRKNRDPHRVSPTVTATREYWQQVQAENN